MQCGTRKVHNVFCKLVCLRASTLYRPAVHGDVRLRSTDLVVDMHRVLRMDVGRQELVVSAAGANDDSNSAVLALHSVRYEDLRSMLTWNVMDDNFEYSLNPNLCPADAIPDTRKEVINEVLGCLASGKMASTSRARLWMRSDWLYCRHWSVSML